MKLALVNTSIARGGAARSARLLNELFNTSEHVDRSVLFHADSSSRSDHECGLRVPGSRHMNALLSRMGGAPMMRDFGFVKEFSSMTTDFDLLHIHNLHGYYLNFASLIAAWGTDRPIIWTWHDMWGATGRCAFSFECSGWETGCGHCRNMSYSPAGWLDFSASEYRLKEDVLVPASNLHIVSPSQWLADIALKRGYKEQFVHVIPYPSADVKAATLPTRITAKEELGLPAERPMILFVANDCGDPRKGYSDFAECTNGVSATFLAIGKAPPLPSARIQHIGTLPLGSLNFYYRAADLMVIPSYADNFPNTVMESIACGTPVLGYAAGGIAEQLKAPGCVSVTVGDKAALRNEMSLLVEKWSPMKNEELASELISYARSNWNESVIRDRYISLFNETLSSGNN